MPTAIWGTSGRSTLCQSLWLYNRTAGPAVSVLFKRTGSSLVRSCSISLWTGVRAASTVRSGRVSGGFNHSGGRPLAHRCTSWWRCWGSVVPGGWWGHGTGPGNPPLWALFLESERRTCIWCPPHVTWSGSLLQRERKKNPNGQRRKAMNELIFNLWPNKNLTMRISNSCGTGLGGGSRQHHPHKVWSVFGNLLFLVHVLWRFGLQEAALDAFIDHKVDHSLWDAGVGSRHTPVEAAQTVSLIHPPHALERAHPSLASIPEWRRGKQSDAFFVANQGNKNMMTATCMACHVYLASNCSLVFISHIGLVAVMAVKPVEEKAYRITLCSKSDNTSVKLPVVQLTAHKLTLKIRGKPSLSCVYAGKKKKVVWFNPLNFHFINGICNAQPQRQLRQGELGLSSGFTKSALRGEQLP